MEKTQDTIATEPHNDHDAETAKHEEENRILRLLSIFWPNIVSTGDCVTIPTIPMIIVKCFPVNSYGEAEFIFGAIKLTTIMGLLLLMPIIDFGSAPSGDRIDFRSSVDPTPMKTYLSPRALGRFLAFWKVFI